MSDVQVRDAAIRRELGTPPTFDLVAHVRNLSRVILPALLIALIVGGLVYLVRGSATPIYESDIVAEVQSSTPVVVSDANLGQLIAPYVALSTDGGVVAEIQRRMDVEHPGSVANGNISVTPGTSPALVFVTAKGLSQEESDKLARVVVQALSDAQSRRNAEALERRTNVLNNDIARLNNQLAAARQESIDNYETPKNDPTIAADLNSRLEQLRQLRAEDSNGGTLQLLSAPAGTGMPVAPKPLVESAVAFLVVLLLVAETLVACRGRFSSRVTDAWARRVSRKFGASLLVQHSPAAEVPPNVALALSQRMGLGEHVLVLIGDGVDATSLDVPEHLQAQVSVHALTSKWWTSVDCSGTAFAILVVSAQDANQDSIVNSLRALAEVDVTRSLVLVGPPAPEPFVDTITLSSLRHKRADTKSSSLSVAVGSSTGTPAEVSISPGMSMYRNPDDRRPVGGTVTESVDPLDRKTRGELIDAQTVTIDRRQLPVSATSEKQQFAATRAESEDDRLGEVATSGVDHSVVGAVVDSTNAEVPTERIMLDPKRSSADRAGQSTSRVGLLRHEGNDGASKPE